MKEIQLTQGKVAIVDDEDFERISQYKWYATCEKRRKKQVFYAQRMSSINGKRISIKLHRFIMNNPADFQIDHKNGNGLDNRKSNLRLATAYQNHQNIIYLKPSASGFRGVYPIKNGKRFEAKISAYGKNYFLGCFNAPEEAARAYDRKAKELHGEFAVLNFQPEAKSTSCGCSLDWDSKFTNLCDRHEAAQAEAERWEHYEAQFGWAA